MIISYKYTQKISENSVQILLIMCVCVQWSKMKYKHEKKNLIGNSKLWTPATKKNKI